MRSDQRRSNGQFQPGTSGNQEGARKRKPMALATKEDLYRTILKAANSKTSVTSTGEKITLFEAMYRGLAAGNARNRLASQTVIDLTLNAAGYLESLERKRQEVEALERRRAQRMY